MYTDQRKRRETREKEWRAKDSWSFSAGWRKMDHLRLVCISPVIELREACKGDNSVDTMGTSGWGGGGGDAATAVPWLYSCYRKFNLLCHDNAKKQEKIGLNESEIAKPAYFQPIKNGSTAICFYCCSICVVQRERATHRNSSPLPHPPPLRLSLPEGCFVQLATPVSS